MYALRGIVTIFIKVVAIPLNTFFMLTWKLLVFGMFVLLEKQEPKSKQAHLQFLTAHEK
jgi:hypothetical protein